ncbi:basic-leucine zipper transcription factor A-like [Papaver somniferum]|uniref:basic-leucine zipper transcription factor A-like n=1 Tax=Papaver somniferum TaxID=3469 RepID=UPI000E7024C8|nr:basic-leucine zipper transcription factor A-like [Papaver somniferum]XP_026399595.1 basic-leucine zipper transcription factor A-like [Papaver somniferum]
MHVHQICVFCKYRGESACLQRSDERHHRLFRPDDVGATFRYYNAQPFNLPVSKETKNRIQVIVNRFQNIVGFRDEIYGLAGIILLLEFILAVNTAHYESLIRNYGPNPPTAVHIRPDYPVRPPQQNASFNYSFVSISSAQQPQRQPCPACIYLARICPENCQLGQYFESLFREDLRNVEDFRNVCRSLFTRPSLVYNNTSQQKLKSSEVKHIGDNTRRFDNEILKSCLMYGTTGIMLSLVRRLLEVNSNIDNHWRQLVLQHGQHHQQVPRQYPSAPVVGQPQYPANLNTGGQPQQQQQRQLQLGVAKRSLEQGESQMRIQRQRLQGPPNQPLQTYGAPPRLQKPAPFQQPYPPAAFQQPPYRVRMQVHQTRPAPRSQLSAVPSQFQPLFAGMNSSSSASSSHSQLQSHQHHYHSSISSSSAALVGQPHPQHRAPQDPYDFSTIRFTGDGENSGWDTEQEQLHQRFPPYRIQRQGYQIRPVLQSQPQAVPSQSQPVFAGNNSSSASSSQSQLQSHQHHYVSTSSSSSAALVGQPHPQHQAPPDPPDEGQQ